MKIVLITIALISKISRGPMENTNFDLNHHSLTVIVNNLDPSYLTQCVILDTIRAQLMQKHKLSCSHNSMYLSLLLILVSNDVNPNAGPTNQIDDATIYPCGTCDNPVTWNERGIVCDTCNQWYHKSCQSMNTKIYTEHVNDSAIAWDCIMCNCPNYSTFCYSLVFSTSNKFEALADSTINSITEDIRPIHVSTPERKKRNSNQKEVKPQMLRILNVNFQSAKNKQAEIINLIDSTKPDVIFGTETWLDASIKDSQVFPDGYNIYRSDRKINGGGVLIAVKDNLVTSAVPELHTDCEIVWCKLEIVGLKTLYLSAFYNPKTSNSKGYEEYGKSMEKMNRIKNAFIISAGDFNLPGWDWENNNIKPNTQHIANHERFGEILDDNSLQQLVKSPTRGQNVLDLIITNYPASFNRIETLPGLSDHDIVFAEVNILTKKATQKPRNIILYRKANWNNIQKDLKDVLEDIRKMEDENASVTTMWTKFQTDLELSIKKNIPSKMAKKKDGFPWITADIKRLIKKRDRWYKRKKKSKHSKDIARFKELKRKTQQEIRKAYWKYIDSIVSNTENTEKGQYNCMKKFWTFVKHRRSDGTSIPPLKTDGVLHSDSKDKANILNNQFQQAFSEKTNITDKEFKNKCKIRGKFREIYDIDITENGVLKLLKALNPNKAAGPDNISPRVLKHLAEDIAPILTIIFRRSYSTGEIPDIWRMAYVCPVFKKGKKYDPINYRPISLTCISCKIMEHIITSHIMKHASRQNIMYPLQHGFRKYLSCETQLIEFVDDVTKNLDQGKQTDCLIMDFSKAFDKVSHSMLIHKLHHYGITGKTNQWIKNFLSNRGQLVVVEGEKSTEIPVESGVPQGSVLGPSLFLFYINDMPTNIKGTVRLFADDTIVYVTVSNDIDAANLQQDLDNLAKWETAWLMKFHPEKCNVLTISKKKTPITRDYVLHGHTLERVTSAKYLGVTITSDLKWGEHINNICTKANKTIGFLKRNINISNKSIKEKAYLSLVRPTLEYASTVWDPYQQNDKHRLEMVQRRAARYVTNRYHYTESVSDMLGQLKWPTLEDRRKNNRLAMMFKIRNEKVDINASHKLLQMARPSRNNNSMAMQIPSCRTTVRKESFYPRTIREWNILPEATVSSDSLESFKTAVRCSV